MREMKRAIAFEERQRQVGDWFASTLVIATAIIAAVRLTRDDISKTSPRLTAVMQDCVGLTRMDFEPDCELSMPPIYKLVAAPSLQPGETSKATLKL